MALQGAKGVLVADSTGLCLAARNELSSSQSGFVSSLAVRVVQQRRAANSAAFPGGGRRSPGVAADHNGVSVCWCMEHILMLLNANWVGGWQARAASLQPDSEGVHVSIESDDL